MFTIVSFFQKLINVGGWNNNGGLDNFQKLISGEGDNLFGTREYLGDSLSLTT